MRVVNSRTKNPHSGIASKTSGVWSPQMAMTSGLKARRITTEQAVIASATDFPAYGQARTSNELRNLGVFVSPSGVRSIWLRHDLANFKIRLKALEFKVANDNEIILTEAQVQALEKNKLDDV